MNDSGVIVSIFSVKINVRKVSSMSLCLYFCIFTVKLNAGRTVTGILRGFDPFMNLVVDEAIEECKTGEKNNIGMVVRVYCLSCVNP